MVWFFECEAPGRVERDLGWSDLALHAADRYALFIRWIVGACAPTSGTGPDERALVCFH